MLMWRRSPVVVDELSRRLVPGGHAYWPTVRRTAALAQVGRLRVIMGKAARARALDTGDGRVGRQVHRIGQHHFHAKFRLRSRDRAVVDLRGITTIRRHAEELIEHRLVPAQPRNDGRQTPYRGHPVFVAQHATATCCRSGLACWHDIPPGTRSTTPSAATSWRRSAGGSRGSTPPRPAAVTGSRHHGGLTDPGGGATTSSRHPHGISHQG